MYFKIRIGYGNGDDTIITIDNVEDLEKAQFAFLTDSKVVFKNGYGCRGKDIISITEDWHSEMGWNQSHRIGDDDWNELESKGIRKKYVGVMAQAKQNVYDLIELNRTDLIGKKIPIQERIGMATSKLISSKHDPN